MYRDLVSAREPPPNRINSCEADLEMHLTEGAVMLGFAMYLFRAVPGLQEVSIHPDGEHGKRFDIRNWLEAHGFKLVEPKGGTAYGGRYTTDQDRTLIVYPRSGQGDVVAKAGSTTILAECKGGILNTRHPGQKSRLRRGLCETVGQLLTFPADPGFRQIAVVPLTAATQDLAARLAPRARLCGIEIAFVDGAGDVTFAD